MIEYLFILLVLRTFCFTYFGVMLLDVHLGLLCLPLEMTISSNILVLKSVMSATVSDVVSMQFTLHHCSPETIGMIQTFSKWQNKSTFNNIWMSHLLKIISSRSNFFWLLAYH